MHPKGTCNPAAARRWRLFDRRAFRLEARCTEGGTRGQDHSMPLVRSPGRRGRQLLHIPVSEQPGRQGCPLRSRQPEYAGRRRAHRRVHARWLTVHRPERRSGLQVQRSRVLHDRLQGPGRSRRYWDALVQGGGEHSVCGWLKDRFGVSWQVVPRQLNEMLESDDRAAAARAMEAMLKMEKIEVEKLREAFEGVPA